MTKPVRIQLSRKAGFRLQAHSLALNGLPAKKADRTTDFGNPYRIKREGKYWVIRGPGAGYINCETAEMAQRLAVVLYRDYLPHGSTLALAARRMLKGHNLACHCRPSWACHVDWLLEISNA